jgi:hypothetical protein
MGGPYKERSTKICVRIIPAEVLADAGHLGGSPSGEPVRDLLVIDLANVISAKMPMA